MFLRGDANDDGSVGLSDAVVTLQWLFQGGDPVCREAADFDKNALATGAIDGKQYGLPTGITTYSLVANTDLLAKYKVAVPDDSTWTWDDLKRVGGELSKASNGEVTGVQSWGFDIGGVNIWARQNGASLYSPDGKVAIPADVLAKYWQYLLDMSKQGIAPSASVSGFGRASGGATIRSGASSTSAADGSAATATPASRTRIAATSVSRAGSRPPWPASTLPIS